jgi:carbon-monoxide dehydrogenase medium subunit
MKPAKFEYHRAADLVHACELLSSFGDDAKLLAGGQSLIAAMNFRLARPKILIDISNVEDFNRVSDEADGVRIRATTTQRFVERHEIVRRRLPVLTSCCT